MKKAILAAVIATAIAPGAWASNYPPDYLKQTAAVAADGPALAAEVDTVMDGKKYVIGYKRSGALAKGDHVNVYLKVRYKLVADGLSSDMVSERQLRLNAEWNGNGFISGEMPLYAGNGTDGFISVPPGTAGYVMFKPESLELAFFVNGQWDSNGGRNYRIRLDGIWQSGARFNSSCISSNVAIDTWNFIVGQLGH